MSKVPFTLEIVSSGKWEHVLFAVPVYFEISSVNRTAVVNQEAALVCNAFGDQPISISWQLANEQIHTNMNRLVIDFISVLFVTLWLNVYFSNRYEIAQANSSLGLMSTLTISKVSRTDGKEYKCVASNQYGTDILPVHLSVFGKIVGAATKSRP